MMRPQTREYETPIVLNEVEEQPGNVLLRPHVLIGEEINPSPLGQF